MRVKGICTVLLLIAPAVLARADAPDGVADAWEGLCFPSVHVVRAGETLGGVALRYGSTVGRLRAMNPCVPDRLRAGEALAVLEPWYALPPGPEALSAELTRGVRGGRRIALTFDCGWTRPGRVPTLLALLDRLDVPAAFFLTGPYIEAHPDELRRIAASGHTLGNHTWSHPDCTGRGDAAVRRELMRVEDAVTSLTGRTTRPWWRPPYGKRNRRVLRAAAGAGFRSVYWTVDSLDWMTDPAATAESVYRRVCARPFERDGGDGMDGAIVLFHAASPATPLALERIVGDLRARGYRFVGLGEMLMKPE